MQMPPPVLIISKDQDFTSWEPPNNSYNPDIYFQNCSQFINLHKYKSKKQNASACNNILSVRGIFSV